MLTVSRFSEILAYCFSHTAQNQSIFYTLDTVS